MAVTVAMWVSADGAANPQARPARITGKFEELYALTALALPGSAVGRVVKGELGQPLP
jgi:hypothetical protein